MLLRSSISSTKKFLHKTLHNVKSFFYGGYHRLPKTPPHNPCPYAVEARSVLDMKNSRTSYMVDLEKLDTFCTDFTQQWGSRQDKAKGRNNKTPMFSSHVRQDQDISVSDGGPVKKSNQNQQRARKQEDSSYGCKGILRDQKNCAVVRKLRELEMLDKGNVDYVLDIEEFLHYYSQLTCPVYLEIVDEFFMDMYSDLLQITQGLLHLGS